MNPNESNTNLSDLLHNQFSKNDSKIFSALPSMFKAILILIAFVISFYALYIYSSYDRLKLIWPEKKCSPDMTFMAALFQPKGDNRSSFRYTYDVFVECNKNVLFKIVMWFFAPFYKLFNLLNEFYSLVLELGLSLRNSAIKVIDALTKVFMDLLNKMYNIIIPFQKMYPVLKDTVDKGNAFLMIAVNTIRGILMTFKSSITLLYQGSIDLMILIALTPLLLFVWPVFIPIGLVAAGLERIFGLKYLAPIPKWPFCFDENTSILTKQGKMKIKDITIGTILHDNSKVTAKLQLDSNKQNMYNLNNVIVSGSHKILFENKWIEVFNHPNAKLIENYNKPYIYCLNTDNKKIIIDSMIFSDWDDIDDNDIMELNEKYSSIFNNTINESNIHKYFESGFVKNTPIEIEDGRNVYIQDLEVNDVLINGSVVKGIVEIDATNIDIYEYYIENDKFIGGPNLQIYNHSTSILDTFDLCKIKSLTKENKLYHVITDSLTIKIKDKLFLDYNGAIETLLIEDRNRILGLI